MKINKIKAQELLPCWEFHRCRYPDRKHLQSRHHQCLLAQSSENAIFNFLDLKNLSKSLTGTFGQLSRLHVEPEHLKSSSGHPSKSLSHPHWNPSPAKPIWHLQPYRLLPRKTQLAFLSQIVTPSAHIPGILSHSLEIFDLANPDSHSHSKDPSRFMHLELCPQMKGFKHSSTSSHCCGSNV